MRRIGLESRDVFFEDTSWHDDDDDDDDGVVVIKN